ncbi:MAG: hypothetical protein QXL78_02000 [Methanocellales archaeon]
MPREDELDQSKVFFICNVCGFIFQEDPDKFPVKCPQCGEEKVSRT